MPPNIETTKNKDTLPESEQDMNQQLLNEIDANQKDEEVLKDGKDEDEDKNVGETPNDDLENNVNHEASIAKFTNYPKDYDFVKNDDRTHKIRNFTKDAEAYRLAQKKEAEEIKDAKEVMQKSNRELQEEKEKPIEDKIPKNPIPDGEPENKEAEELDQGDQNKEIKYQQDIDDVNKKTGQEITEWVNKNEAVEVRTYGD